jgi:hypothetical protein
MEVHISEYISFDDFGQGMIECSATKDSGLTYTITGTIDQIDETTIKISELPVRKWTQDYKEFLDVMMTPSDKNKEPFIKVLFARNLFVFKSSDVVFHGFNMSHNSLIYLM